MALKTIIIGSQGRTLLRMCASRTSRTACTSSAVVGSTRGKSRFSTSASPGALPQASQPLASRPGTDHQEFDSVDRAGRVPAQVHAKAPRAGRGLPDLLLGDEHQPEEADHSSEAGVPDLQVAQTRRGGSRESPRDLSSAPGRGVVGQRVLVDGQPRSAVPRLLRLPSLAYPARCSQRRELERSSSSCGNLGTSFRDADVSLERSRALNASCC